MLVSTSAYMNIIPESLKSIYLGVLKLYVAMDINEYTSKTDPIVTEECKEDVEAQGTSPTQEKALVPVQGATTLEVCLHTIANLYHQVANPLALHQLTCGDQLPDLRAGLLGGCGGHLPVLTFERWASITSLRWYYRWLRC